MPRHTLGQTITNGDGSPLLTKYCWEDANHEISGQPAGGVFSGCGVFQQNNIWYFNAVAATQGLTVFPVQCSLSYIVAGSTVTIPILIWKPVVITPALEDSFTCNGKFYLHASTLYAGAYDYSWTPAAPLAQPDSPTTEGYITASRTFVLTAKDHTSGCIGSDTLTINKYPVPDLKVSNDTIINARAQVQLHATGADRYLWQPADWLDKDTIADPLASPHVPLTYQVIGTNAQGCMDTAAVRIDIREELMVPNAFSPNGDGLNDVFRLENFGYQDRNRFVIFNRWGQKIFQTQDISQGWDGTQNGKPVETGTYYYDIRLEMRDGSIKVFRGDVALMR
jgi:gliding motility-associated-like protein